MAISEFADDGINHNLRIIPYSVNNGSIQWTKTTQIPITTSNLPFDEQVLPHHAVSDGQNVYISGTFTGTIPFNVGDITTAENRSEVFVLALDGNNGDEVWVTQSTGS